MRRGHIAKLAGLLMLGALVTGCEPEFAYTSQFGVRVYTGELDTYFTAEEIDMHAAAALADMTPYFPEDMLREGFHQEVVSIFSGPIYTNCPSATGCNGLTLENGIKVRAFPCKWNTALRHEMVHHLEGWATGVYDYKHEAPHWKNANDPVKQCDDTSREAESASELLQKVGATPETEVAMTP